MVNSKNTLMTKMIALLLSIVMLLSLFPVGAIALDAAPIELGELSCITENGILTDATGREATATFAGLTLNWSEAEPSIGRTQDGWWIGVKMTAPKSMTTKDSFVDTADDRDIVTYKSQSSNGEWSAAKSFWNAQDSDKDNLDTARYLTMWGLVTEEYLNCALLKGVPIRYAWQFDWDGDGSYEQVASLRIDPKHVTLVKGEQTVYPSTGEQGTVSVLSPGLSASSESNGNFVEVYYASKTEPSWSEAAPQLGRSVDGWWAGIKVTAPSAMKLKADFTNVTYKSREGTSWSAPKSFWNAQDSDKNTVETERYLTMWGLMIPEFLSNAKENNVNMTYAWQFDWNGDGVYEQMVMLKIDPDMVTLKEADGTQVYPSLGTVSTITGGTVEGSGTGNVTVTADNLSLNWSKADLDIGRNVDGWWAGIKITAPAWVDFANSDVNYQSQVGNADWSSVKSFNTNKDSDDYMTLWTVLTPEKLKVAEEAGENIVTRWKFDWDGDGEYEQTVEFVIVPGNITLNKVKQTDFAFKNPSPKNEVITKVWTGEKYDNPAFGGQSNGEITYWISDGEEFASVDANGVLTFKSEDLKKAAANENGVVGTVTVKALLKGNDVYLDAEAEYTITIYKQTTPGINFEYGNEIVTYEPDLVYKNQAKHSEADNSGIVYEIVKSTDLDDNIIDEVATIDTNTGELKIKRSGIVTVRATRPEDALYTKTTAEYTLTIKKADQDEFAFTDSTPDELIYSFSNTYDTIKVEGGKVEGENTITYTITSGNNVAEVVDGNKIKTLTSGVFTLEASIAGNDFYNTKTISKEFTVVRSERKTFAFEEKAFTVVYNENGNRFEMKADTDTTDLGNEERNSSVTYEIVSGEAAEIKDPSSSVVTIKKSGTVVVRATMAQDDKYEKSTAEYTLTIETAEQSFAFIDGAAVVKKYGIKEFFNEPVPVKHTEKADGKGYGNGAYTVVVEANDINAKLSEDGKTIVFGDSEAKIGTVTVHVTKAADECYKECSASYTIEIEYPTIPDPAYSIDKQVNANGWYNGDFTISAPDGYTISYYNELSTADWAPSVSSSDFPEITEGENNIIVYLMKEADNGDREITDAIHILCKIDKGAPTELEADYDVTIWVTIAEKVFGFKADTVRVTLSAKDAASGIEKIEYSTDGVTYTTVDFTGKNDATYATCSFDLEAQYRGAVVFKVTDMAGHESKFNYDKGEYDEDDVIYGDDKTIVVDAIDPEIEVGEYVYGSKDHPQIINNIIYTNAAVNIPLSLTADNFDLSVPPTVKVNGEEKTVQWNPTASAVVHEAKLSFKDEGAYVMEATFKDRLGRTTTCSSQEIRIDWTPPVRVVTPSDADRVVSSATLEDIRDYTYSAENTGAILYYKDKATVTFKVTEANFYKEDVHVFVNGKETIPTDWKPDENNNWIGTITIADEGDYIVTMTYTDRSNNEMVPYQSQRIVVDHSAPTISVDYSNSDVKNTIQDSENHDRKYFDKTQTATITIKEHNFRPNDVIVKVKAKDVVGSNVATFTFDNEGNVIKYFTEGSSRTEWAKLTPFADAATWRRADDTYKLVLEYANDANYSFDIEYKDLAGNEAAAYAMDYFTVDKTAPTNLAVSYSTSVFENVLESITFGFYNAQMTVTITAEDDISGVYYFIYSYLKSEGVSSVNAELLDQAIRNAEITYDGGIATASFNIPKYVLGNDNQFNGTVDFTASDCAENSTEKSDAQRIVVDNISPKADVTYNPPVHNEDNISYYNGDVNATVTIREANFYSEDVRINVTRDGVSIPVNVNWINNSVDEHIGKFTLHEDGDYIITINYADRSTNAMDEYVSNQLTIDTKNPVISVSNVKHQSANNEETISITVSVTDINIPLENFKPVLNAVIKKDNGGNSFTYETKTIDLGKATTTTNANGETVHSYTVSNLETDGYYSLACIAVDYANHSVSTINAATDEGGNTAVEAVNFSVNREGSVFWIETEHNDRYLNETFTDKLNGAYANDNVVIKLHEVNVDKVDENTDKRTVFTLNDGSKSEDIVLKEGDNYSKNVIVGAGGWYETVYTLDNNTFDHDGVYSLNVITYDKAGNSNVNTKTETGTISFTLDRTNPVISANVKTNQSIRDAQFWVEFEIAETNLDAETIVVKLTDNDGKVVETNIEDLGNNGYRFLVESGFNYSFEITAKDLAGNESELYRVEHVTVSTNIFILWYANTPLFWGSIGGTVLLAGCIFLLIFLKKRKKNEEK